MNAYFFTGSTVCFQIRFANAPPAQRANRQQRWSSCQSLIVCAENPEAARKPFEQFLCWQLEGESPIETEISRVVAAQLLDQMLTEKGFVPMDWTRITQEAESDIESAPVDAFEQGYWVDVNEISRPNSNIEALRDDLPEDIRSGLNWAEDKQFFFLLSVLSPSAPPPLEAEDEPAADNSGVAQPSDETDHETAGALDNSKADFPELVDKEAAVLIRARNSAVASWLWRQYAPDPKLAGYQIRIDPWCGMMRAEDAYRRLGRAKRAKGDLEGAIKDYTKAIELNPKCDWAYFLRGCLNYDLRAFADALLDFHKVLELDSFLVDYAHFRICLIHTRLGTAEAARGALRTYLVGRTRGEPDDWASQIGHFLADQVGESEFLAAANNTDPKDPKTKTGQICQAYFYAGSKRLFTRDAVTAADYFQKSIATDASSYTEYGSAGAELNFLRPEQK